jgi:hypothetical protein
MSIDLQEENHLCNNFGYAGHVSSLKYWTQITQGINLSFSQLMKIYQQTEMLGDRDKSKKGKKEKSAIISIAD